MVKVYIFDIDGTLADNSHRTHFIEKDPKDWDSYYELVHLDAPIPHIVQIAKILAHVGKIIYVSGRRESTRAKTVFWLEQQYLPISHLYMRADGDYRHDYIVKAEILEKIIRDGYEPIMAFDDRNQVVDMWRSKGIPCAQVAPGDF